MHVIVVASTLAVLAATFGSSGYVPVAPFLASKSEVGWLLSAQGLGCFVAIIPAGKAVDRMGSSYVLKVGMSILATSVLLSIMSPCFPVQLLGRICSGIAGSVMFNAAMAMIMENFQEPSRGEHIGTAIGLGTLGNCFGPSASGYVMSLCKAWDLTEPQVLPLLLPLFLLLPAFLSLLRVPEFDGPANLAESVLVDDNETKHTPWQAEVFGVYAAVGIKSWSIAALLANLFCSFGALVSAGTLDLHSHGFSAAAMGLASMPAGLAQVVMSRVGGQFCGTHDRRVFIMTASPLAVAVGLFGLVAFSSYLSGHVAVKVLLAMLFASAAMAAADAPSISAMAELASLHGRGYGEVVTATELAVTAGQAVGPILGVAVLQTAGFDTACLVLAATSTAVGLACAWLSR
eukprot:TRINITY_DN80526_c0_g1_i1.p1 TRINITY_DN80526_c0_g1~~TRINITY_DN80526_c0_g1_i1.p1  ORF type:complete len:403 (-),score=60.28 TRINITY_DN80526_c0_g1_i1:40-1248(-)